MNYQELEAKNKADTDLLLQKLAPLTGPVHEALKKFVDIFISGESLNDFKQKIRYRHPDSADNIDAWINRITQFGPKKSNQNFRVLLEDARALAQRVNGQFRVKCLLNKTNVSGEFIPESGAEEARNQLKRGGLQISSELAETITQAVTSFKSTLRHLGFEKLGELETQTYESNIESIDLWIRCIRNRLNSGGEVMTPELSKRIEKAKLRCYGIAANIELTKYEARDIPSSYDADSVKKSGRHIEELFNTAGIEITPSIVQRIENAMKRNASLSAREIVRNIEKIPSIADADKRFGQIEGLLAISDIKQVEREHLLDRLGIALKKHGF